MEKRRRKTVEIPDEGDATETPKRPEPFLFYGDPSEQRPVVLQRDKDGNPTLTAPPRRYWIKIGDLF